VFSHIAAKPGQLPVVQTNFPVYFSKPSSKLSVEQALELRESLVEYLKDTKVLEESEWADLDPKLDASQQDVGLWSSGKQFDPNAPLSARVGSNEKTIIKVALVATHETDKKSVTGDSSLDTSGVSRSLLQDHISNDLQVEKPQSTLLKSSGKQAKKDTGGYDVTMDWRVEKSKLDELKYVWGSNFFVKCS